MVSWLVAVGRRNRLPGGRHGVRRCWRTVPSAVSQLCELVLGAQQPGVGVVRIGRCALRPRPHFAPRPPASDRPNSRRRVSAKLAVALGAVRPLGVVAEGEQNVMIAAYLRWHAMAVCRVLEVGHQGGDEHIRELTELNPFQVAHRSRRPECLVHAPKVLSALSCVNVLMSRTVWPWPDISTTTARRSLTGSFAARATRTVLDDARRRVPGRPAARRRPRPRDRVPATAAGGRVIRWRRGRSGSGVAG